LPEGSGQLAEGGAAGLLRRFHVHIFLRHREAVGGGIFLEELQLPGSKSPPSPAPWRRRGDRFAKHTDEPAWRPPWRFDPTHGQEAKIVSSEFSFLPKEDAMAGDWAADVKKYVSNADDKAIAGIVRYCGIALQKRDSSLVSFTDNEEVARVRDHFLKKKLGLTNPDAELDQAIKAVADKMKGDRTRNRVTVYYLLAEHFGKLSAFS
jgi:hypothetical protein